MNRTQELQYLVDGLAEKHVPALRGARVIHFVRHYEIWLGHSNCLAVGSFDYCLMFLGCVALTKQVRGFKEFSQPVFVRVCGLAVAAGVL